MSRTKSLKLINFWPYEDLEYLISETISDWLKIVQCLILNGSKNFKLKWIRKVLKLKSYIFWTFKRYWRTLSNLCRRSFEFEIKDYLHLVTDNETKLSQVETLSTNTCPTQSVGKHVLGAASDWFKKLNKAAPK